MRKIKLYENFLEEKLELLLEAKISFSNEFVELLNKIESPIVKKILDLSGEEVDINRNYMTYDIDKEDSVLFYADDKAKKQGYKITSSGHVYSGLADVAKKNNSYPIKNIGSPENYQKVNIIKELTKEELEEIIPGNSINNDIVHISFNTEYGEKECFYSKKELVKDISKLKPSETKVGRFVNNLLTKGGHEFTHEELNDFIVKYKSEIKELKEKFNRFEIVKGNDIRFWYNESRYLNSSGTLGSSCMKHQRCQNYFGIYTENEEVSLIILKSKDDPDRIIGRALLWDIDLINREDPTDGIDRKFMDRIYTSDHSDENFFIKFARSNGFYYKKNQDYSETPIMLDGDELDDQSSLMTVSIMSGSYNHYPYMDTMKYYDENGILSNDSNISYDYLLNDTNGGNGSCEECGGSGEVECGNCDGDGTVECDDCYSGSNNCSVCDGDGKVECYDCDGEGTTECNNCDGDGKVECGECYGSGEDEDGDECSCCSGSGKEDCSECEEGKNECSSCRGNGTVECDDCEGSGDIECESCGGEGEHDCYRCEGDGRHDCRTCNN